MDTERGERGGERRRQKQTDRNNRDENNHYNDKQDYKIMHILGIRSIVRPKRKSCTVRKNNNTAKNKL